MDQALVCLRKELDESALWTDRLPRLFFFFFKAPIAFNHSLNHFTLKVVCANNRVLSPIHLSGQGTFSVFNERHKKGESV